MQAGDEEKTQPPQCGGGTHWSSREPEGVPRSSCQLGDQGLLMGKGRTSSEDGVKRRRDEGQKRRGVEPGWEGLELEEG